MTIHKQTTIALNDDNGELVAYYTQGDDEFRIMCGEDVASFNVKHADEFLDFIQQVRDMQSNDADLPTAEDVRGIMKPARVDRGMMASRIVPLDAAFDPTFDQRDPGDETAWKAEWQVTEACTSEPIRKIWLHKCKPGDICVRADGKCVVYEHNKGVPYVNYRAGGVWYDDKGISCRVMGGSPDLDIVAVIPSDCDSPSGTACDTLPVGNQRDPGDETPERPRPRRDGPGLDVKGLACVADLESRN